MHFSLFLHCISLYQVLEFPLEILEASKAPERGTGATCDTRSRRIEGWRDALATSCTEVIHPLQAQLLVDDFHYAERPMAATSLTRGGCRATSGATSSTRARFGEVKHVFRSDLWERPSAPAPRFILCRKLMLNLDHPRSIPIAHEFSLLIRKKALKEPNFQYNNYQQKSYSNNQQGGYQQRQNTHQGNYQPRQNTPPGFNNTNNQSTQAQGSSSQAPTSDTSVDAIKLTNIERPGIIHFDIDESELFGPHGPIDPVTAPKRRRGGGRGHVMTGTSDATQEGSATPLYGPPRYHFTQSSTALPHGPLREAHEHIDKLQRWNKAQDRTIFKLKTKYKELKKTVKKQAEASAQFMKKVADLLVRGGVGGCSSEDFVTRDTSVPQPQPYDPLLRLARNPQAHKSNSGNKSPSLASTDAETDNEESLSGFGVSIGDIRGTWKHLGSKREWKMLFRRAKHQSGVRERRATPAPEESKAGATSCTEVIHPLQAQLLVDDFHYAERPMAATSLTRGGCRATSGATSSTRARFGEVKHVFRSDLWERPSAPAPRFILCRKLMLNLDHPRSIPIAHEFSLLIRKKALSFIAF
ncbi:hypothetical protein IGI04_002155 [Brassica rapa subsp. trilocularis]|uniref:Arabidopsis retrotransposon Orf1 C-terminal domain-containing protein n=1 Tax=Brassica rapa subsp. trilocularis TaxID=1813537 RepID=A0ABQ7NUS4_BRACM|nr:hypothetical protein IGI04_002155 [Brassica rapa subsp. trilocularis]